MADDGQSSQRMNAFLEARPEALRLAARLARVEDREDLLATASAALWEATLRWDPERGSLWTFAQFHVRAALLNEIRRHSLPLSREDFARRPVVLRAAEELRSRSGRDPADVEVADLLGLPLRQVRRIRAAARITYLGDLSTVDREVDEEGSPVAFPRDLTALGLRDLFTLLRYTGLDDAPPESLRRIANLLGESHETTRSRLRRLLPVG
jgi:hypothetical protein